MTVGFGTSEPVWVAGDALVGPSTVIAAMAQGCRAAPAILDRQPSAPSRRRFGKPATAVVAFESRGRLAEANLEAIATADLVILGTKVQGFVVSGVRPARATQAWLDRLLRLGAKQFVAFCPFRLAPKRALGELCQAIEARCAHVVATGAFGRHDLSQEGTRARFALAARSRALGEPDAGEVAAAAIAAGERPSANEAGQQLVRSAGYFEPPLARARQQLVARLQDNGRDLEASRALRIVQRALSELDRANKPADAREGAQTSRGYEDDHRALLGGSR